MRNLDNDIDNEKPKTTTSKPFYLNLQEELDENFKKEQWEYLVRIGVIKDPSENKKLEEQRVWERIKAKNKSV